MFRSKPIEVFARALGAFAVAAAIGCAAPGVSQPVSDDPRYAETTIHTQTIPFVAGKYAGSTVAVVAFANKSLSEYRQLGDAAVGILPEYLLEAGFQPIESSANSEMDALLTELRYGRSENVDASTAAAIGYQLGARYVFLGGVNNYRVIRPKASQDVNLRVPGMGRFGGGLGTAKITYDLQVSGRLVDVESRAIVASKTIGHKEAFELNAPGVYTPWGSYGSSAEIKVENNTAGSVLNHALNRIVVEVVHQLNRRTARMDAAR